MDNTIEKMEEEFTHVCESCGFINKITVVKYGTTIFPPIQCFKCAKDIHRE